MKSMFALSLSFATLLLLGSQSFMLSRSKAMPQQKKRQLVLGQKTDQNSAVSMNKIDHASWTKLLQTYVDESGAVNYNAWNSNRESKRLLDKYIDQLSTASLNKAATREAKLAFWINAYNAVTVKGILQEYPTTSIRNHTSRFGGYNIWKHLLLNVGGQQVSLDSIEHKILRPMGDPRIHFAIVCASKGCPRLLNEAYIGETLDEQLDANAKHFFSLAQNFQHDLRAKRFKLSAIMSWFGSDFGANQAEQLNAIAKYLPAGDAQVAARSNTVSVSYLDYSWDLNEQPQQLNRANESNASKPKAGSSRKE